MNLMQTKIQQIYKDYLDLKNYIQEESKSAEKIKKEVHDQALQLDTVEEQSGLYFDRLGNLEILKLDYLEQQKKLYYFIEAYRELVEIPEDILNEFLDYKVPMVFAIVGGKKEIIDKNLYDSYRKKSQEYSVQLDKYNQMMQNREA